jgi:hypothetical protein
MRIPFADGWLAVVYRFKAHNLIVETAPDDPQYVVAVQIQGDANPDGMGFLGINLGDEQAKVIAAFGEPTERRASVDEKTGEVIPDAFIYQYTSASFEVIAGRVTSIKAHFLSRAKARNRV